VGKPLAGLLSDRYFGGLRRPALLGMAALTLAVCVVLALAGGRLGWAVYPAVAVLGFAAVGWGGVFGTAAGEIGGAAAAGRVAGFTAAGVNVGIIFGPPLFGLAVDATGSYKPSWLMMAGCAALAMAFVALWREPQAAQAELVPALADPERTAHPTGDVDGVGLTLVDPRDGHRAVQLVERAGGAPLGLHEREDGLGVDRHARRVPFEAVLGEDLLVVADDPVVDPDDRAVPNGVVVRLEARVALRVVADVDERLRGAGGHVDLVEKAARARPPLVDGQVDPGAAVAVAGGVGSPLGDRGHEDLGGESGLDAARVAEAISGDPTQDS
jgi:hypothetical protein